ncbi:NAD-dependent epimerase/dehydratase family protein [Kaistella flava (ex Peng et al. 2021)]|uniref:NAD-dependent epimerase/dehydratase family protein n=1 Tax=Kaistella flava (ex Peng et al. 2021) TaxID=2038776 RepID=A0A7M2Y961_9FLAO|nr:NAD(P)H-binding protein [Kaistella flava (ex Peng et al. 2021)]QOW10369.1 NAD-dependent epimerase/dehydratase family protein [Kaistella flava (ex Peng et al. 2021)]
MKISLIGATGYVGNAILKELLERNYQVTAIARNTDKLNIENKNLQKKNIDIFNQNVLAEGIKDSDAVISAYNPGWTNPNIHDEYLKGAAAIQNAVESSGVKKLIVIGGAGTLKIDGNYGVDNPDFPKQFYPGASAVKKYFVENLSKNKMLDWEFFSPAIEMSSASDAQVKTGKYRLGKDSPVFDKEGRSRLSVEDLAVAIVDELENKKFNQQIFTAAY